MPSTHTPFILLLLLLASSPMQARAQDGQQPTSPEPTATEVPPPTPTPAPLVPSEPAPAGQVQAPDAPVAAPTRAQGEAAAPELKGKEADKRSDFINQGALAGLGKGALIGLGTGVAVGGIVGFALLSGATCDDGGGCVLLPVVGAGGLGLIGVLLGAMIGGPAGAKSAEREWDAKALKAHSPSGASREESSAALQLMPTVGVGTGGVVGGVLGRF